LPSRREGLPRASAECYHGPASVELRQNRAATRVLKQMPARRHMTGGRVETIEASWNVLHKEDLSEMLMERTTSTEFVFPKPNRIVFLKRGVWYKVAPVKANAPFARCAIAGFFLGDDDDVQFWR